MLRSTTNAGKVRLSASSKKLGTATIDLETQAFAEIGGLSKSFPSDGLALNLQRGETPQTPSFIQHKTDAVIVKVDAGSNVADAKKVFDKNERTSWSSSGIDGENWISFTLDKPQTVSEISIKMKDFRSMVYPIAVYADDVEVFRGTTHAALGYIRLPLKTVEASKITIKALGKMSVDPIFGEIKELEASNDEKAQRASRRLSIVELQLILHDHFDPRD